MTRLMPGIRAVSVAGFNISTLKGHGKLNSYNSDGGDFRRDNDRQTTGISRTNSILRMIFGIFMIVIYVGMGVLLLINFFGWDGDWAWTRYVVGIVLIIYGIWRAYRQIKGIDNPYMS